MEIVSSKYHGDLAYGAVAQSVQLSVDWWAAHLT